HGSALVDGLHTVTLYGETSHARLGMTFTAHSSLTLTPAGAAVGDQVTVGGGGFLPGESVLFYCDGDNTTVQFVGSLSLPYYTGSLQSPRIPVPSGAATGAHPLAAYGVASGVLVTGTVGVISAVLDHAKAAVGATVGISGAGFQPGEPIRV